MLRDYGAGHGQLVNTGAARAAFSVGDQGSSPRISSILSAMSSVMSDILSPASSALSVHVVLHVRHVVAGVLHGVLGVIIGSHGSSFDEPEAADSRPLLRR